MEPIFEIVLGLFGEILFNLVIGAVVEFVWQSLHNSFNPARHANKWFASVGLLSLGLLLGALSGVVLPVRLTPVLPFPGLSLVVAPALAGSGLEVLGGQMDRNGMEHTSLMTWWGGGLFALGMAVGRLLVVHN